VRTSLFGNPINFSILFAPIRKGDRKSIHDALHLIELAKVFGSKSKEIFSVVNCFDYSDFCSEAMNIYGYSHFSFYSKSDLVENYEYLPSDQEILEFLYK
jgi:hypothetical protein